jgi:hypothetical protein
MYDQNQESQAPKHIYVCVCVCVCVNSPLREKGEGEDKTQKLRGWGVMTRRKLSNRNQIVGNFKQRAKTHSLFATEAVLTSKTMASWVQ